MGLRKAISAAAVVAGAVTLTTVPPHIASAETVLLNGAVINDSALSATALRNWCSGGSTGTLTTTRPTCGNDQGTHHLAPGGGRTPSDQDWDVVQIDAGWCYYLKFDLPGQPDNHTRYDRRGKSAAWVKVEDWAVAHIVDQSANSCP